MKKLTLTLLAAALLGGLPTRAHATYTLTLSQVGNNVLLSGSGTLNTTGLTAGSANYTNGFGGYIAYASVGAGTPNSVQTYGSVSGPANFGSTTSPFLTAGGTGSITAIYGSSSTLVTPVGYVSGSALSGTNTLINQTFATIGFVPGTYTYNFNTGANADTFVVTSGVPEPSTWALLGVGAGLLGLTLRQRRARAAFATGQE